MNEILAFWLAVAGLTCGTLGFLGSLSGWLAGRSFRKFGVGLILGGIAIPINLYHVLRLWS